MTIPARPATTEHATAVALRLDDVGAASKQHEIYGVTRIRVGPVAVPFPGNLLFLKYLPWIKRWGPYPELTAAEWDAVFALLAARGAHLTVAVTAGWVESDGRIVPFPEKLPDQARVLREAADKGLVEIANHGYTHCLLEDGLYRPKLFRGNRPFHREFYDWLPEETHREHLSRAQEILGGYFGEAPVTLVPPGNVFSAKTVRAAVAAGIRYLCCRGTVPDGSAGAVMFVDDARVIAFHDRDVVLGGAAVIDDLLDARPAARAVTVRELAEEMAGRP